MESLDKKLQNMKDVQSEAELAEAQLERELNAEELVGADSKRDLAELHREEEQLKERFQELMPVVQDAQRIVIEAKRFVKTKGDKLSEAAQREFEDILLESERLRAEYDQVRDDWEAIQKKISKAGKRAG